MRGASRAPPSICIANFHGSTPMYELAPYVFACTTGRNCMFLDLRRDQYVSIPRTRFAELGTEIYGWQLPPDHSHPRIPEMAAPGLAEELLAAGILRVHQTELPRPRISPPPAERDSRAYTEFHATFRPHPDHARVLSALVWADYVLRNHTLFQVVERIATLRSRRRQIFSTNSAELAEQAVHLFYRARPWYPRNYLCLFDSLALLRYLCSRQLYANWIFGVREDPFAAHCWLQYGTLILNDYLDRARVYTPIMVV